MSENRTNTIGRDFTMSELIRFVAAPVITRLLVSLLSTLDDSLFVSRYCGQNALAAFSIALPWFMLIDAIGMLAGATSTICSIKMGEKKNDEAMSDFTTMCIFTFVLGLFFTVLLLFFLDQLLMILGETEILMPYAKSYMSVSRFYIPMMLTGYIFGSFYVIAGKPKWAMYASLLNTLCQFFFDWLFIVKMNTGIVGAAYGNLIGTSLTTLMALFFFSNRNREIHFVRPQSKLLPLLKKVFIYGRVQFITSIAISVSTYINNAVQLSIGGERVVAAYTIASNVTFLFMNSLFGLIGSLSPLAAYAYGEKNASKFAKVCRQSMILVGTLDLIIVMIIFAGRGLILDLYLTESSDPYVRTLATTGLSIYPLSLLFLGPNILVQDYSNVVGRHKVSTFLSVMENVVFQNAFCLLLPRIFGINGVWFVFLTTEFMAFLLSSYFVYANRNVYGYGKDGIATFVN
ncbi:MAG: hypothetical protein IJI92_08085 [Erysipelotrichaceae bacterium]|nr:hypothetical protein [Erysipelotrichaceae bacterium]